MPDCLLRLSPGLILIVGALLIPFLKGNWRSAWTVILPALALLHIHYLPTDGSASAIWQMIPGLDASIEWLRVDKLSKAFGYIFAINAVIAFVYAFHYKKSTQHVAALVYIGGALGTIFSGDLISAYVNWEIMAVASTFVILANRDDPMRAKKAKGAAFRYLMLHILGGLFFLAGLVIHIASSDSFAEGIAFTGFTRETADIGVWLILAGFLVNAAAPPLHAWLSDAYPEASVSGGLILSAYTTKTAVYTLLRGFHGGSWDILIWIGCGMAVYGIIYALLENDMRRILAYSIINQVGFMVCAAGIGTPEAISGATAHAFCHIIYKSLLWMSAGAVLFRVGKSKCTDLGGLYKTMPWTMIWGTIGALAISAVPLTSGFTSKTIIIEAAHQDPSLKIAWLILEIASAGVFLHAGIKFPYFVFFNQDKHKLRPKEAPMSMLLAMGALGFLCIFLGCYWGPLYDILPHPVVFDGAPYQPFTIAHVITQSQLLMFAGVVFFLFLPLLKRTDTIAIDTDIFWRKGGTWFYNQMDRLLNGINSVSRRLVFDIFAGGLSRFFVAAPSTLLSWFAIPIWKIQGKSEDEISCLREHLFAIGRAGAFPIGLTALLGVLLLALLSAIFVMA